MGTSLASLADQELSRQLYEQAKEITGRDSTMLQMAFASEVKELRMVYGEVIPKIVTDRVVHDFALKELHPGRFVAYVENETEAESDEKRLRREIVGAARSMIKLEKLIKPLPDNQRKNVNVRYIRDPLSGFRQKAN